MKMIALTPNCCPNQDAAILIEEKGGVLTCPKCKKEIGALRTDVGLIYVLSSEAFSGLHKIGFTVRTIDERLEELNCSTSLPHPFKLEMSILSLAPINDEKRIHKLLSPNRVNDRREFFRLPLIDIHDCIVEELGRNPLFCSESLAKDIERRKAIELHKEIERDKDIERRKKTQRRKDIERRKALQNRENSECGTARSPFIKSAYITAEKTPGILGVAREKPDKNSRRPLGLL